MFTHSAFIWTVLILVGAFLWWRGLRRAERNKKLAEYTKLCVSLLTNTVDIHGLSSDDIVLAAREYKGAFAKRHGCKYLSVVTLEYFEARPIISFGFGYDKKMEKVIVCYDGEKSVYADLTERETKILIRKYVDQVKQSLASSLQA